METSYFLSQEQKVVLTVEPMMLAVRFREPAPHALRSYVIGQTPGMARPGTRLELPGEKYTLYSVAPVEGQAPLDTLATAIRQLESNDSVVRVAPVFQVGNGWITALDRVVVGVRRGARGPLTRLEEAGFKVVDLHDTEYLVRVRENDDPLRVVSRLALDPDVEYAEPDFVELQRILPPGPAGPVVQDETGDDPYANSQWARKKTNADHAFEFLEGVGKPEVRIAIVDAGVQRRHPDLRSSVAGQCDATLAGPKENPQPQDEHGTACAGLAAAIPFNEEGLRGFGGGCSILDIRVFYSVGDPRVWVLSSYALARGIDWAVCNGADVLSLSWATDHPRCCVTRAIQRALTEGRKGKGCVVVAGTGNDEKDTPPGVKYPARLDGVLAVGATDKEDRPVRQNQDGSGWASAVGIEVDLAAPGVMHVTTDNLDKDGANTNPSTTGDYRSDFWGTSSSTAIVAGAAGLVLSANPALTGADVSEILCSTAEKVTTVTYTNGHSEEIGFGRLDLLAAVKKARGG